MLLYIDASTGGMMLQIVLTGIAGGLVMFKLAAGRIFNAVFHRGTATPQTEEKDPAQKGDESGSIGA
jgi:hypothetical protein